MGIIKKQVSVTVMPEISPRIENWLMGRDIEYEVETIRKGKSGVRLKILAYFPSDGLGQHQSEVYKRFLERIK